MASIVNTKGVDISYWNGDINFTLFQNYITVGDDQAAANAYDALSSAAISPLRFTTGVGFMWKYEKNPNVSRD